MYTIECKLWWVDKKHGTIVQGAHVYAVATEHYVRLSPDFFAFQHGEPFGRFLILGVAHLT